MKFTATELTGEITLVALEGSLDIAGADEIGQRMGAVAGSRRFVIVDLEKVSFLASMGIRVLLSTAKTVSRQAGRLVLVNPNAVVRSVLNVAGTDTLMPVADSVEAATALCAPV